jgi:hypothetical protein
MMALWDQICVAGTSEVCEVERPGDRGVCHDRRKPEVPPKSCQFSATVAPPSSRLFPLARNQPRTGIPPTITGLGLSFLLYLELLQSLATIDRSAGPFTPNFACGRTLVFLSQSLSSAFAMATFSRGRYIRDDGPARGLLFDGLLPV